MSVIQTLTEGIRQRTLSHEGEALLEKWEKTGLLEGLNDTKRSNMARLLENQAAQLLKEVSSMSGGDVEGFASVAFPIVRRVFGNLLAQDLVSVQPMSLPSGLIFFLDFTVDNRGMSVAAGGVANTSNQSTRLAWHSQNSLYGGNQVGSGIVSGVDLSGVSGSQTSFYNLNAGYSSPTGTFATGLADAGGGLDGGVFGDAGSRPGGRFYELLKSEPSMVSGTSTYYVFQMNAGNVGGIPTGSQGENAGALLDIVVSGSDGLGSLNNGGFFSRILTRYSASAGPNPTENRQVYQHVAIAPAGAVTAANLLARGNALDNGSYPIVDTFQAGTALGSIVGAAPWGLENTGNIPEIDIRVDSIAVTALTKKLKAKWTPELAQDLNAYHNLDAEVELTSILSEQIALEIDQEILADLVDGATGATLWWSRLPGKFVNRETGDSIGSTLFPDFTGTVSEWYETLLETINEVSARIHRKTLRGGANFVVVSPEVANILEFTSGFRAVAAVDDENGSWGVQQVGSLSRKMDVHVDPYFPRNLVLVGRRGKSFLESGYVYAPYVPLQVTPTIFGPEDFVPRKGVMTRYAKQMVRPDMYGLVVVADLIGGSTS